MAQGNLTKGKPSQTLIRYALPYIGATFLQALFQITDVTFMGHFDTQANAAGVGIGGQVVYLVLNAVIGLAAGGTVLIGQSVGKKDEKGRNAAVCAMSAVLLIVAVVVSVAGCLFAAPALRLLRTPADAMAAGEGYVKISMAGSVFAFVYNGVAAVMRGLGDSKRPLVIVLIACLMNIGLDALCVGALKWGAAGAAWTTVFSWAAAAGAGLFLLKKKTDVLQKGKFQFRVEKDALKRFLKTGVPIAVLNMAATVSFMLLTVMVNAWYGGALASVSAHAVGTKYNGFAVLPSRAMASAIAAVTAQNVGAKQDGRVKPTLLAGTAFCLAVGAVLWGVTFFFPQLIFKVFGANAEAAAAGSAYLKWMSLDYLILPLGVCAYGAVEGYGKTGVTMAVNAVTSLFVRVPAAYFLARAAGMGLAGVGLAVPLASFAAFLAIWSYILIKRRKTKRAKPLSS